MEPQAGGLTVIYLIQFILYRPELHIFLRGLYNLYTYDIPVPGPHLGSGKTPKNKTKTFTKEKMKKPSGEQQRRIPLPGWTEIIDVMCTDEQRYRDTTHSMNMTNV